MKTSTEKDKEKNEDFQMGGPSGALFFSAFFPGLTYFVVEKCQSGAWDMLQIPRFPREIHDYLDYKTTLIVIAWFLIQCVLYLLPLGGGLVYGTQLRESGNRLQYRMNAFVVMVLNIVCLFVAALLGFPISSLSSKLLQMLSTGFLSCVLLSLLLYVRSYFIDELLLNTRGNTGHIFYDWFQGRELNPRFGLLDLKYVMFRSGITGWIVLNFVNIFAAFETKSTLPISLILLSAMQLLYVSDYFWFEEQILVSRDIVHEGLGFNIAIQFLMIPFTFSVQTSYLLSTGRTLPWYSLLGTLCLNLIGYLIYRGSNSQKNNFRQNPQDPSVSYLKTMSTASGKKLLISGWWGMCRHPNYFGDLIISLSYALTTGFGHFLPYLNFVFLVFLLLDREKRDSAECKIKYGADWDRYCEIVKYRIIPFVY